MTRDSSEILDTVHRAARALHHANIMDTKTMREFDSLCLVPPRDHTTRRSRLRYADMSN